MQIGRRISQSWPIFLLKAATWSGRIIALALFFFLGYFYRSAQFYDRFDHYDNVLILETFPNKPLDFKVQVNGGAVGQISICPTTIPKDFSKGRVVLHMYFEQQADCKNLNGPGLGYEMQYNEDGQFHLAKLKEN